MTILIFWVLFAVACGVYASNRGRSGVGWFLLSLVISPLLGLIFVAVSKDLSKNSASAQPGTTTHVKCPACAEWVLPQAVVCKHCGGVLTPPKISPQRLAAEAQAKDTTNLIIGIVAIVALFAAAGMISKFAG